MRFLYRFSDIAENLINAISSILIGFSTLLAFVGVILRYFFGLSYSWAEEIIVLAVIYGVFLISGPNIKRGIHISIDLLVIRLPSNGKRITSIITNAAGLFTSLFLTYAGVQYVVYLKKVGVLSTSSMEAPMYLILSIFPIGMGLMAIFYFEQLLLSLRDLKE